MTIRRRFSISFDRNMPGYATLQDNIEGLLAAYDVGIDHRSDHR